MESQTTNFGINYAAFQEMTAFMIMAANKIIHGGKGPKCKKEDHLKTSTSIIFVAVQEYKQRRRKKSMKMLKGDFIQ